MYILGESQDTPDICMYIRGEEGGLKSVCPPEVDVRVRNKPFSFPERSRLGSFKADEFNDTKSLNRVPLSAVRKRRNILLPSRNYVPLPFAEERFFSRPVITIAAFITIPRVRSINF